MSDARPREVSITFSAAAGLGLQTAEDLCRRVLSRAGFYVFSAREYMSRVRGGNNSTQLRIATHPVRAATRRMDWLIPLSPALRDNVAERISPETRIAGDVEAIGSEPALAGRRIVDLALARSAAALGGSYYASMIVAGFLVGLFALPDDAADGEIAALFANKTEAAAKNREAFRIGHALARHETGGRAILAAEDAQPKGNMVFLDGDSAAALGAASAGCNFIAAYPMSPGTGIFTFFAKHRHAFGCVVEQVEDEIAAINMAIGASYAGARALVTTSGGGFSLMCEGVSLAGMSETPVVIHLAQRPGPATGLATRTEQGDLFLALHAGHGDFPRALYAPVNIESAYRLAGTAFHTAWKYQTPVVLMTDQYLLDNAYDIERPAPEMIPEPPSPVMSSQAYRRYAFPQTGQLVSPFSVPGYGDGLVSFDSHEHTEAAHITEDRSVRTRMTEKRLAKMRGLETDALPPIVAGPQDCKTAVVCWGSTFEIVKEAVAALHRDDIAVVACEQVYPLSSDFVAWMRRDIAKIFVEGNAAGHFARLVRMETGVQADAAILKYDGFQFTADELTERIGRTLDELSAATRREAQ